MPSISYAHFPQVRNACTSPFNKDAVKQRSQAWKSAPPLWKSFNVKLGLRGYFCWRALISLLKLSTACILTTALYLSRPAWTHYTTHTHKTIHKKLCSVKVTRSPRRQPHALSLKCRRLGMRSSDWSSTQVTVSRVMFVFVAVFQSFLII